MNKIIADYYSCEIRPSFWARVFNIANFGHMLLTPIELTIFTSKQNGSIALDEIDLIKLKNGIIWSSVHITKKNGNNFTVAGISHSKAYRFNNELNENRNSYLSFITLIGQQSNNINDLCKAIKHLISSQFYSAHHMIFEILTQIKEIDQIFSYPDVLFKNYSIFLSQIKYISYFEKNHRNLCDKSNEIFINKEQHNFSQFFDQVETNPLTEMQRRAIVIHEDNTLVIAGAGSGKTSVIVAKAGYLLQKKLCSENSLLLLAFNRNAAEEISERIQNRLKTSVEARTFHSLGLDIIAKVEGKKPSLDKTSSDHQELLNKLRSFITELNNTNAHFNNLLKTYFQSFFAPYYSNFEFKTLGDYYQYLRNYEIRSLQRDLVKSYEECEIANYLYLNGISYQYEPYYKFQTATISYRQYQPDFYLLDYDVYIEHFAIDEDGNVPSFFKKDNEYLEGMEWKRKLHETHKTTLIETYSYQKNKKNNKKDCLLTELENKLKKIGVKFNKISVEETLKKLNEYNSIDDFTKILASYLNHYKGSDLSINEVLSQSKTRQLYNDRFVAFLGIFEPVLNAYGQYLKDQETIDFNDMIIRATKYVASGHYHSPFKCILVDEFQDMSIGRGSLVKALIKQKSSHRLFCVGDDWQSIYRFAGSDITLMTKFENTYGYTATIKLDQSFRFNNQIASVTTKFITENPHQIKKTIRTNRVEHTPMVFIYQPEKKDESMLAQIFEQIPISTKKKEQTVMLLGRYNFDGNDLPFTDLRKRYPYLKTEFKTIHSSKGLEADHVVLLGLRSGRYGFPSEIIDDPIIETVLASQEDFPNAEERRLFYVALTRARHSVHIEVDRVAPSKFIHELSSGNYDVNCFGALNNIIYCPMCTTGQLIQRTGPYSIFYSCTNYPYCDYKTEPCRHCGSGLLLYDAIKQYDICTNKNCNHIRKICPSCKTGRLVEKSGAYGTFIGCTNYSKKTCKHTEKILTNH